MGINSLEIKDKTNYGWDNVSYIDDFDLNSLKITKKETRIGANIYYTRCALNLDDDDTIIPLHFLINRLIGFIEKIDGSSDKYLVAVSSLRNKNIINALDKVWSSIKDKVNPGIKIKDYDKFRFNSDIDLPVNTIIEFRSLLINVSCVIEKDNEYYPEIYLDDCSYVKIRFTKILCVIYKMSSSERIKELKIDSTSWTDPKRVINLLHIDPNKLTIYTELNSISNTPDTSSKDLIEVYEVRYDDGGFYLVIDDINGYFNIDDNVGSILSMILTDDQKNKYHQVWKEIFKNVDDGNGELRLHEKIRLIDSNFPIEKIFKIHSITIVMKSLIEKDNKFYLELALNRCLFEPYEIKL